MKIFLSYGHDEHAELARRLKKDLEALGHKVWMDIDNIQVSQEWEISIEQAIDSADWVVVLMTPHSIRRPDGVCLDEISYARFKGKRIAPVMVQMISPPLVIARMQWLDLQNWKCRITGEFQETVYQDGLKKLLKVIDGENKLGFEGELARLRDVLKPFENGMEISRYVKEFVGRDWFFRDLQQWINSDSSSRILWIKGPAGIGKTALAAMICHKEPTVVASHFCKYNDSDRSNPKRLICSLAYELATQIADYSNYLLTLPELDTLMDKSVLALFNYLFVEPLSSIPKPDKKAVLAVIDALDEVERNSRNELLDVLAYAVDKLPSWFGLIITSRPDPAITRKLSRLNPYELDRNDPRNIKDITEYLNLHLKDKYINQKQDTTALLKNSEGSFLYVEEVVKEIEAGRLSVQRIEELPQGLTGVFLNYFEQNFPDETRYKRNQRPLLELLVASQEPLLICSAANVLKWDEYDQDDILKEIGSLFMIQNGMIEPFHKSVIDWLIDWEKSGIYRVSESKGHERFCERMLSGEKLNLELSDYFDRFGAVHLLKCERYQDLVKELERRGDVFASSLRKLLLAEIQLANGCISKGHLKTIFKLLVNRRSKKIHSFIFSLISSLIDYSLFAVAKEIDHLLQSKNIDVKWLTTFIDFQMNRMTGNPKDVVRLGKQLLKEKELPKDLFSMIYFYLAEGLREQGNYQEAMSCYVNAIKYIDQQQEIVWWLKVTRSLALLEHISGKLTEARNRLNEALKLSKTHHLMEQVGAIYRQIGHVELVLDHFEQAETYYNKSLEIALKVKRPKSIIEAYNSLAEAQRTAKPEKALENVYSARKYAEQYHRLELGKGYYIEADILNELSNFAQAEEKAREGLLILQDVGYEAGIARAHFILAQALFHQNRINDALEEVLLSLKFYQREKILPYLRIRVYHLLMQCAEKLGKRNEYLKYDDIGDMDNIHNFPNLSYLVDLYSS